MVELSSLFGRRRKADAAGDAAPDADLAEGRAPGKVSILARLRGGKTDDAVPLSFDPDLPDPGEDPKVEYVLDAKGRLSGGGRRMALGLQWEPRQTDKSLNAQARESAFDEVVPGLATVFADGAQVGFGLKAEGARAGMVAAATAIPQRVTGDSWVGAFRLEAEDDAGGVAWWLVALRDGLVYEDRVLRDAPMAQEAFFDLLEVPGWKARICPEGWNMPDTVDLTLGHLLPRRARGAAVLRPHDPKVIWAPRVAILLMLAMLGGGALFYQSYMEEQRRLADLERRRAAEEARRAALNIAPWVNTPDLAAFIRACSVGMDEVFVLPPGWRLTALGCTLDTEAVAVRAEWRRDPGGRASWFLATMADRGVTDASIAPTLETATLTRSVPVPVKERRGEQPLPTAEMERLLRLRLDTLSLDAQLRAGSARAAPRTAQPGAATWTHHEFRVTTSAMPTAYADLLADIPGVLAKELTYDPYAPSWDLTAMIYHPPVATPQRR